MLKGNITKVTIALIMMVLFGMQMDGQAQAESTVVRINFQTVSSGRTENYFSDKGYVFTEHSNGLSYGWNEDNVGNARDRYEAHQHHSPDKRYNTLNHMQLGGSDRFWEIALDDGWYAVYLVAGDPQYLADNYRINVEGQLIIDGTPNVGQHWLDGHVVVQVTDGRLTVSNAAGASGHNKVNFIEIEQLQGIPGTFNAAVNFGSVETVAISGYDQDSGDAYNARSNGMTYGWRDDLSDEGRNRDWFTSPDERYDTLMQMQHDGNHTWEMAVPNGRYVVYVQMGDPQYYQDHLYALSVEDTTTMNGEGQPVNRLRSIGTMVVVEVSDGFLTIENTDFSSKNKVQFIHIQQMVD